MMKLKILGSSSSGNCYILEGRSSALIIECGVSVDRIKQALDFNLSKVAGCIVTHTHNDHARSIGKMVKMGIPVLALPSVFSDHDVKKSRLTHLLFDGHGYRFGDFKVASYKVTHDVPCVGYLISHPEMGRLLFVTDTMTLDYRFTNLNNIMIEANYADEILQERIERGEIPASHRDRLRLTHMELKTTKQVLSRQNLMATDNIILIHLSNENSDAERFQSEVTEATGKMVYVADTDMTIDLTF